MTETDKSLRARVARLEAKVTELERRLDALASKPDPNRPLGPSPWRPIPPREPFRWVEPPPIRKLN